MAATDTDNTIENNQIVGNSNGIFLAAGVQGNIIRGNVVVGNPPVQVGVDHTANGGADIKNLSAAGANLFDENICLTGINAPCPTAAPNANSRLESLLQSVGCKTYPPTPSCQLTVSQWNYYFAQAVNPDAPVLSVGDGTQLMTVQQYLQARAAAGL